MGRTLIGTSGWSYAEWVGVFYPSSTESKLRHYTHVFSTVEIDSTFYAFPQSGVVQGWNRYTPGNFLFAAKLPKAITHDRLKKLDAETEKEMDRFAELMMPLNNGEKLACLLIQLPPSYTYDLGHLEQFLAMLPHGFRYAAEFRHKSWLQPQTWKTLEKYNVAYTIVDEPLLPPDVHLTADFAYLRWHGHGQNPWYNYHYSNKELEDWKPRLEEVQSSTKNVYGYFNNHFHGYAVENALKILRILGKLTPEQEAALTRAERHLQERQRTPESGLGKWMGEEESSEPPTESKILDSLSQVMGKQRLERAMAMDENEVSIEKASSQTIEAHVRNYSVLMDKQSRTIVHDCGDWERAPETRQLCKHLGRLFLSLPERVALEWLSNIESNTPQWNFKTPEKQE